ncbi:DUF2157 domain-containing protein [Nocardioides pinisoli]|uniref:DUF2157 domain-containing protein n=1 Tax=Nocardioides pinisoli TaxID=2950279 RepID=A0ABT1L221_9ACTN|nr:DUF2157 domain-containing protein [Nocardioides pinisoli]MCP3424082.1 DUF2157 domain-containing protein [Nocardioides pinisoli]
MGSAHQPSPSALDALDEWVASGLLTPEQSRAIREHEAARRGPHAAVALQPSPEAGPSLVVEALGYLGGVVMLIGAGILTGMLWPDLSVPLRLALIGAAALALIGAGFAVPERLGEVAGRVRSVLWALGVGATAGFFSVFSTEVLDRYDEHALVVIGPLTAVVAGALWWLRRTWLQQLALLAPLLVSAMGVGMELTSTDSSWGGALVWATAACWAALSWAGRLEPRVPGVAFGALGAVLGALAMPSDVGIALALATAVAAVGLALWERSLPWLGVAAITLLWTMPRAADAWFPGRLSAALTLLATGATLVGAAVWVARHQGAKRS